MSIFNEVPFLFMLSYRENTWFNREITARLSLLLPDKVVPKGGEEDERQDKVCNFDIDDPVWARVYSGKKSGTLEK